MTFCLTQMLKPEEFGRVHSAMTIIFFMVTFLVSANGRSILGSRKSHARLDIISIDSSKIPSTSISTKGTKTNIVNFAGKFSHNVYIQTADISEKLISVKKLDLLLFLPALFLISVFGRALFVANKCCMIRLKGRIFQQLFLKTR